MTGGTGPAAPRVVLVSVDGQWIAELAAALRAGGAGRVLAAAGGEAVALGDSGAAGAPQLIACDCRGESGFAAAFFAARAAPPHAITVFIAAGSGAEVGAAETLAAGIARARPQARVVVIGDDIPDAIRRAGGARRQPARPQQIAAALLHIGRTGWPACGRRFHLHQFPAIG